MLDLILPVTDDEDNQEQVAAVRAFSTAPLVLLTNYHGEARRLRDLANGADFIRFRLYSFRLVAAKVATLTQRWPRRVASASAGEARGSGPAWC